MLDLLGKATFTAEQISAIGTALDSYGLKNMPAFRKIGGILAEELPIDEAEFHAAILAINLALDENDAKKTLKTLQNPSACLTEVDQEASKKYHLVLKASKEHKMNNRQNLDGDFYEENLAQEEIQSHLDKINQLLALEKIENCVKNGDFEGLKFALNNKYLSLGVPIKMNLMEKYGNELLKGNF